MGKPTRKAASCAPVKATVPGFKNSSVMVSRLVSPEFQVLDVAEAVDQGGDQVSLGISIDRVKPQRGQCGAVRRQALRKISLSLSLRCTHSKPLESSVKERSDGMVSDLMFADWTPIKFDWSMVMDFRRGNLRGWCFI